MASVLTVDQLLQLHPWPAQYASEKRLEWLWHFDLPGDSKPLWRLISDTSRLNRLLGVAEMQFAERDGKNWGTAKNGGVLHEWVEVPWNWIAGQWLTCTRIYERGFSKVMYAIHRLERLPTGTRVYLYFGAIPRGVSGKLALKLGFPSLEKAYAKLLPQLAADLAASRPAVFDLPPPELSDNAKVKLGKAKSALVATKVNERAVEKLFDWIATGDELDLYRIQIRERAQVWAIDESELLRVAMHATRLGVLELSWDIICPHCRGVSEEYTSLNAVEKDQHCDACQIDIDLAGQETVEVTFRVHPSIREIANRTFCSAEPATKDHIAVQLEVAANSESVVVPQLGPGRYRVRSIGTPKLFYVDIAEDNEPADVDYEKQQAGSTIATAPGAKVRLFNQDSVPRQMIVENAAWHDYALGPRHLLSLAEFRDLFSSQFSNADIRLSIGEQTIMFTDVVGSTAFYEHQGDPVAFVEIKRHFDEAFALVAQHNGAVIKTIGDAVMAAFREPLDAVRCAGDIHRTFGPQRTDCPIRLRISLHTGPCIAVKLGLGLDFFGGTVNIAAKLQALAETWQVAMSARTFESPGVQQYLADEKAILVGGEYRSKAMKAPIAVQRWDVFSLPEG